MVGKGVWVGGGGGEGDARKVQLALSLTLLSIRCPTTETWQPCLSQYIYNVYGEFASPRHNISVVEVSYSTLSICGDKVSYLAQSALLNTGSL